VPDRCHAERYGAGHQRTGGLGFREEVQVPGKRVSMRKTREVLRLHFDLKLGQRPIARSANTAKARCMITSNGSRRQD
jgi:hypothetical protein